MSVKSLWHESTTQSSFREFDAFPSGLLAIKTCYSMISTGTERLVACGLLSSDKGADNAFADKMAVQHQQGSFSLPIKYGYSLVGYTPDNKLVHVMHPHQNIAFAQPEQLFELPAGVNAESAALISNMETIVNGMWDSELFFSSLELKKQQIGIVGFGNVGALLALTLKKVCAVNPIIVETDSWRLNEAQRLGFEVRTSNETLNPNHRFDLLFHSTGHESGLDWCLSNASIDGVIIDLSWYGAKTLSLRLGKEFHYHRLRLISSQVSHIPRHKPQESYLSRKQYCAELLKDPIYLDLISAKVPFNDAPDFFDKLRKKQLSNGLIWLFDYQANSNEQLKV